MSGQKAVHFICARVRDRYVFTLPQGGSLLAQPARTHDIPCTPQTCGHSLLCFYCFSKHFYVQGACPAKTRPYPNGNFHPFPYRRKGAIQGVRGYLGTGKCLNKISLVPLLFLRTATGALCAERGICHELLGTLLMP